jgi:hypothetical protein
MRLLDANIFIYAYYKPKRKLTQKEEQMKEQAKKIISDVSQGKEEIMMTVVHLSEAVNILKHGMPLERLTTIILGLFMLDNMKIQEVSGEAYFAATELGDDLKIDPNDALAIDVMKLNNITEIYSFDEDFERMAEISRLPKLEKE